MAKIFLCVYGILLVQIADSSLQPANNSEGDLLKFLFTGYNPEIRPVANHKDAVNVQFGMAMKQIIKVDFTHQILTLHIWVRMYWKNEFLKWSPENFGGLKSINIDPVKVWIPDIILYNRASINAGESKDLYRRMSSKVILNHNGETVWLAPTIVSIECKMNVQNFPFDNQKCYLEFGSWTHSGRKLDTNLYKPYVDKDSYSESDEWVLYNTKANKRVMEFTCCPDDPWPTVIFTLFIKRRAMFYLGNLILPCGLITIVSLFSFILPPNSGERVSFVITILLALIVYMMIVTESMPQSADMPIASKFFLFLIFELSLSLVVTCFIIRLHNNETPLPKWLDIAVNKWLVRIMFMNKPKTRTSRERNGDADNKVETSFKNQGYLNDNREETNNKKKQIKGDRKTENFSTALHDTVNDNDIQYSVTAKKQTEEYDKLFSEIKVIADKTREERIKENFQSKWIFTANVLDRFFLCILIISVSITFIAIFTSVPKGAVVT